MMATENTESTEIIFQEFRIQKSEFRRAKQHAWFATFWIRHANQGVLPNFRVFRAFRG